VRLLTSFAVALIFLTGCSDSKSNAITPAEVTKALRSEGLRVSVANTTDKEKFQRVFAQDIGEIDDVVAAHTLASSYRPTGRFGVGDLVVAGLIYRHAPDAPCSRSNVIGACLHKRNVVIVVRRDHAAAARRALARLG
jgi:hypothetical protein